MKSFVKFSFALLFAIPFCGKAQTPIDQVNNTTDKVNSTIDKVGGFFKKKKKNTTDANSSTNTNNGSGTNVTVNSSSGFTPGNTIIFTDHFDSTVKGNFPANWLTNASGEVVTTQQYPGKWFSLTSNGVYIPKLKDGLPKDFTVEFDLIVTGGKSNRFFVDFENALDKNFDPYPSNPYLQFRMYDTDNGGITYVENRNINLDTRLNSNAYNAAGQINHIAFKKLGERLMVFINQEKTYDINQAFEANKAYSTFKMGTEFSSPTKVLVSNVRIAAL